jgi:hypothetical protein
MLRRVTDLPGLAVALAAGGAWYLATTRIMFRLGTEDAAQAVGVLAGIAVALSLWRRSVAENARASLDRLICPRCAGAVASSHEHAGASHPGGLQLWSCSRCGYEHAEALTCASCAV